MADVNKLNFLFDDIESNREVLIDDVVRSLTKKIESLGFETAEDDMDAIEKMEGKGFSDNDMDFRYWDGDVVREFKNPDYLKHPWDWYSFSICSVACGDTEIFYIEYTKE